MSSSTFWDTLFSPSRRDLSDLPDDDDDAPSSPKSANAVPPNDPPPKQLSSPLLLDNLWSAKLSLQAITLQQTQEHHRVLLETVQSQVAALVKTVEAQEAVVKAAVRGVEDAVSGMEERGKRREGELDSKMSPLVASLAAVQQQMATLESLISETRAEKERERGIVEQQRVQEQEKFGNGLLEKVKDLLTSAAAAPIPCGYCNDVQKKLMDVPEEGLKELLVVDESLPPDAPKNTTAKIQSDATPNIAPEILIVDGFEAVTRIQTRKTLPAKRTLLDDSQEEFDDDLQLQVVKRIQCEAAVKEPEVETVKRPQKRRLLQSQSDDENY